MTAMIATDQTVKTLDEARRFGHNPAQWFTAELISVTTGARYSEFYRLANGRLGRVCGTCGGSGYRPEYAGIYGGQCFPCGGSGGGKSFADLDEVLKAERTNARAAQRRAEKAAQAEAERPTREAALHAELTAAHPLLAELTYLGNVDTGSGYGINYGGILGDLRGKLEKYGSLSDAQIALAEKIVREDMERQAAREAREAQRSAEREARKQAAIGEVGERREFTGTVRFSKYFTNDYSGTTLLVIDTAEGTVKWFATGYIEIENGANVTLRATVKEHEVSDVYEEIATKVTRGKLTVH